jgi:hypothetical protein
MSKVPFNISFPCFFAVVTRSPVELRWGNSTVPWKFCVERIAASVFCLGESPIGCRRITRDTCNLSFCFGLERIPRSFRHSLTHRWPVASQPTRSGSASRESRPSSTHRQPRRYIKHWLVKWLENEPSLNQLCSLFSGKFTGIPQINVHLQAPNIIR